MLPRGFWTLCDVSDDELLLGLTNLLAAGARTESSIIAHLAEVDVRRLTLVRGSSLFDYCVRRLGLSEHEAYLRIAVARAARRFPVIFELLARRELHLTAIALLGRHLTRGNHVEVLSEARGKTKRALLKMMARRWPKADFSSHVRRLPIPREGVAAGPTGSLQYLNELTYRLELCLTTQQHDKLVLARDLLSHANPSGNLSIVVERALDLLIAQQRGRQFGVTQRRRRTRSGPLQSKTASVDTNMALGAATEVSAVAAATKVGAVLPGRSVGGATTETGLVAATTAAAVGSTPAEKTGGAATTETGVGAASAETAGRPVLAEASVPAVEVDTGSGAKAARMKQAAVEVGREERAASGVTVVAVPAVEAATELVCASGAGAPAATAEVEAVAARADDETALHDLVQTTRETSKPSGRRLKRGLRNGPRAHIPNEVRRQLLARDGFCCTYTSPSGERCQCRRFLQIHHEKAWAKGGPDTLENLRLVCAEHNQLLSELEFGTRHEKVPA